MAADSRLQGSFRLAKNRISEVRPYAPAVRFVGQWEPYGTSDIAARLRVANAGKHSSWTWLVAGLVAIGKERVGFEPTSHC